MTKVPLIFISSAVDNMNIDHVADVFIPKPFDHRVLMAKLQALPVVGTWILTDRLRSFWTEKGCVAIAATHPFFVIYMSRPCAVVTATAWHPEGSGVEGFISAQRAFPA